MMWPALLHVVKRTSVSCSSLLRRVSKSIELALWLEGNLPSLLFFNFAFEDNFQVQAPGGAYIWRGEYMEGPIFGILRYTRLEAVVRNNLHR